MDQGERSVMEKRRFEAAEKAKAESEASSVTIGLVSRDEEKPKQLRDAKAQRTQRGAKRSTSPSRRSGDPGETDD